MGAVVKRTDNQQFNHSGIYKITNLVTGKIYIGSAVNIKRRLRRHFNYLEQNIHPNRHLQSSYNKYGPYLFIGECLEKVINKSALISKEQYWLDLARNEESHLYNLAPNAGNTIGVILSSESRILISNTLKQKGIKPPSRTGIGYGFCKLYCPKGHYKTSKSLIHGSNSCKECQRIKSQQWRLLHR